MHAVTSQLLAIPIQKMDTFVKSKKEECLLWLLLFVRVLSLLESSQLVTKKLMLNLNKSIPSIEILDGLRWRLLYVSQQVPNYSIWNLIFEFDFEFEYTVDLFQKYLSFSCCILLSFDTSFLLCFNLCHSFLVSLNFCQSLSFLLYIFWNIKFYSKKNNTK